MPMTFAGSALDVVISRNSRFHVASAVRTPARIIPGEGDASSAAFETPAWSLSSFGNLATEGALFPAVVSCLWSWSWLSSWT